MLASLPEWQKVLTRPTNQQDAENEEQGRDVAQWCILRFMRVVRQCSDRTWSG